jgi:excisionase family DNA binding protein
MREILGVKMYNVKEVTEILGVTTQTVRLYIKQRKLKAVRIGKPYFISEDAIKFYITGGLNTPDSPEKKEETDSKQSVPSKHKNKISTKTALLP